MEPADRVVDTGAANAGPSIAAVDFLFVVVAGAALGTAELLRVDDERAGIRRDEVFARQLWTIELRSS